MAAKKLAPAKGSNQPIKKQEQNAAGTPDIAAQIKRTQEEIAKRGGNAPNLQKRLNQLQGKAAETDAGLMSAPPTIDDKFTGLTGDQSQIINQMETGDVGLGYTANKQLDDIQKSYEQPIDWSQFGQMPQGPDFSNLGQRQDIDWSGVPQGPVSGDFNNWRQQQIDATYSDFSRRMEPQFKQQENDFQQQMANRGIPVGSDLYNRQLKQLQDSQADQRNAAMVQAQGIAGQNAQQFAGVGFQANSQGMQNALSRWDVGNQQYDNRFGDASRMYDAQLGARSNRINDYMMQRGMPLYDYNQLRAAQSPLGMQNMQYSQSKDLANQQYQQQLGIIKATPRGGGGGGGGSPSLWQQYGFSSPQELDAYKNANSLFMQQQQMALQQQYQPKQPNPYYGLLGQVGGIALGSYLGS